MLYDLSKMVARLTGVYLQPNKAIVGENAFAHESDIADGVMKKAETYEPITPELVGHREVVMGKHVGSHLIQKRIQEMGLRVNNSNSHKYWHKIIR